MRAAMTHLLLSKGTSMDVRMADFIVTCLFDMLVLYIIIEQYNTNLPRTMSKEEEMIILF